MDCEKVLCTNLLAEEIETSERWKADEVDDDLYVFKPALCIGNVSVNNTGVLIDLDVPEKYYRRIEEVIKGKLNYNLESDEDGYLKMDIEVEEAPVSTGEGVYCYYKEHLRLLGKVFEILDDAIDEVLKISS